MDAVKHMLIYLFNENKNKIRFVKNEVYSNYFNAPYIKSYFEINGIEIPTEEGAKRRIPFIFNILDAFGIINLNRSDFELRTLPYVDCIFTTDTFSPSENINATKEYYKSGTLPPKEQLSELKMRFGSDFLTDRYLLKS